MRTFWGARPWVRATTTFLGLMAALGAFDLLRVSFGRSPVHGDMLTAAVVVAGFAAGVASGTIRSVVASVASATLLWSALASVMLLDLGHPGEDAFTLELVVLLTLGATVLVGGGHMLGVLGRRAIERIVLSGHRSAHA